MNAEICFQDLTPSHRHFEQVVSWILGEWGEENGLTAETTRSRLFAHAGLCPPPQLALSESNQELIGVVGFSRYPRPGDRDDSLWIDVLYVTAEARGRGHGTALIEHALSLAPGYGSELYVYSECCPLYQRVGFEELSRDDKEFSILRRDFSRAGPCQKRQ